MWGPAFAAAAAKNRRESGKGPVVQHHCRCQCVCKRPVVNEETKLCYRCSTDTEMYRDGTSWWD